MKSEEVEHLGLGLVKLEPGVADLNDATISHAKPVHCMRPRPRPRLYLHLRMYQIREFHVARCDRKSKCTKHRTAP